jgi:hypothetical protein
MPRSWVGPKVLEDGRPTYLTKVSPIQNDEIKRLSKDCLSSLVAVVVAADAIAFGLQNGGNHFGDKSIRFEYRNLGGMRKRQSGGHGVQTLRGASNTTERD